MSDAIKSLTMPKWGLTMTEGTVIEWLVGEGEDIAIGDEVVEVETDKMTGPVEAQVVGTLRRHLARPGDVVAVGGMLAVLAPVEISDEEIQAFIDRTPPPDPAAHAERSAGPRSETIDGPLGRINVLIQGEDRPGDPVVLLHGFGGDALNWRFNMEALSEKGAAVLAIDLPGHGASAKAVGNATLEDLVASVFAVLEAKGLRRIHLAGHSLGGLVATRVATTDPDRVASLTLIAPAGLDDSINAEFVDGFVAGSSRRELKAVLRLLFADENMVSRQLVEEVLRYKRLEGVPEALAALRDAFFPDGRQAIQTTAELETVRAPLVVIWGAEDQVLPSRQASVGHGSARVEIVDAAGHSPHIEDAAAVNRILTAVLDTA